MGVVDWSSVMIGFIAGAGFVVIIGLIVVYKDSEDWLKKFEKDHKQDKETIDDAEKKNCAKN